MEVSYCDLVWNTNESREKEVVFDMVISGKYITLDHSDVIWNYNNVKKDKGNDYISTNDGSGFSKMILDSGYYTFKEIAKVLKKKDITLTYDKNTLHSKVETKLPLRLWKLGKLLGFKDGTVISTNSSKVSESIINMNDGFQTVTIMCNRINSSQNFFNGNRTEVLWTLSIPSDKRLKGGVSEI